MSETVRKLLPLLTKYGYVDACAKAAHENRFYGPCGHIFLDNIEQEWRKSFLSSAEVDVFPFQQNGISVSNSRRIAEESTLPGCLQHMNASLKSLVDTESTFGLISTTDHQNDHADNMSCSTEAELFSCIAHPTFWTRLQFALSVPSSKLFYWLTYWQRQRLVWWKRLSGKPSGFSMTEASQEESNGANSSGAGVSIRRQFPWGEEAIEHIRAVRSESGSASGRSWIICNASVNVGAAAYLWDAVVTRADSKTVLALHHKLTPYKATVASTLASLRPLANLLTAQLRKTRVVPYVNPFLNYQTPLDAQVAHFDEMGVCYTVILNESTQKTGVAYVRHRDTMLKEQVHVTDVGRRLPKYLQVPEPALS